MQLAILALTTLAGLAQAGRCPSDYAQQMMVCARRMQNLGSSPSCSDIRSSFDCIGNLVDDCPGRPGIREMTQAVNLDQMRSMIEGYCTTGTIQPPTQTGGLPDNCPGDYLQQLTSCSQRMQRASQSFQCRFELRSSIDCLAGIFDSCSNQPGVSQMAATINLNSLRSMVDSRCGGSASINGGVEEPVDESETEVPDATDEITDESEVEVPDAIDETAENGSETCIHEDTSARLRRCNRLVQSVRNQELERKQKCRNFRRGIRCFRDLIENCPNDDNVVDFTNMVDLSTLTRAGMFYCPGLSRQQL